MPKLQDKESARRLWEPILSLGLERGYWVESFLSSWFIRGLQVDGGEPRFFREWKEMIDFAWSKDNWAQTGIRERRSSEELFLHLMGFSFGECFVDNVKYLPSITAMKPQYDRWADRFLPDAESSSYYARFLICPSAANHLRDGVQRLSKVVHQFKHRRTRDLHGLDSALLGLLEHDWRLNEQLIKSDADVRSQFMAILKTLADRQLPRALELQDRIARTV